MSGRFNEIFRKAEITDEEIGYLEELTVKYPYFIGLKSLLLYIYGKRGDAGKYNSVRNSLGLRHRFYGNSEYFFNREPVQSLGAPGMMNVIEDFLSKENLRIVPDESVRTGEHEVVKRASEDNGDGMVSEKLAEIYLIQGLRDKAISIYRKLYLKYPEKSVYFAEIIEKLEKEKLNN